MTGKVTLQDIAGLTGVSTGTVHKALSNSKGVSETKRNEILKVAEQLNYSMISAQASPTKIIAALFPEPVGEDRYFYQYIWAGIAAREEELKTSFIKVIKISFDGSMDDQMDKLEKILEIYSTRIHGILTIIWEEARFLDIIERFESKGIKVFTISADAPASARTASIMANSYKTGRLAAEYLGSIVQTSGKVMVIGTKRDAYNHLNMVRGFIDQMNITNPELQIIEVYESKKYPEKIKETVNDFLSSLDDIKGIYTNNARTTAQIIKVLKERDRTDGGIVFVGSEIFQESIDAMKNGTLKAIIDQNAFHQAYDGLSIAYNMLVLGKKTEKSVYYISGNLYLHSNLPSEKEQEEILENKVVLNQEFNMELKRFEMKASDAKK